MLKHWFMLLILLSLSASIEAQEKTTPRFTVSFSKTISEKPVTGRVLVMLGQGGEPRNGPNWFRPMPFFARDVKDWAPETPLEIGQQAISFPSNLTQLPAREYTVQAVLDLDLGNTHRIGSSPGNGYSKAEKFMLDPQKGFNVNLLIDQIVKEPAFKETSHIKLVEIQSKLLSDFHGKPVRLRAGVRLPKNFETSQKKYPVVYEIPGFGGDHRAVQFSRLSSLFPIDMIHVVLDPDCSTGHHVFADSVNNGPYGQALITELIPEIEKRYRGVGKSTARFLTGHSSGGWSSLWLQVTYPDYFGGTWSTAPDPVDFRDFQQINIYKPGTNMFVDSSGASRPIARRGNAAVLYYKPFSDMETVMGRGGQLYSFEAVFSPKDGNGKPRQLWDRTTGAIDLETARYWERYDIRLQLERNWASLAPRLIGKIHVFMGDLDTFYLEGATKLLKESLARLGSDAVIEIVPGKDHGSLMTTELYQRIATEMADAYRKHHSSQE